MIYLAASIFSTRVCSLRRSAFMSCSVVFNKFRAALWFSDCFSDCAFNESYCVFIKSNIAFTSAAEMDVDPSSTNAIVCESS